ncbi:asparaginase [Actinosynnema sp. NPDC047251]|uniref:L-asparaginase II n=1 Tax=Saccharothrix espanaensis (strain ATCC 51144 / DSM 44229 / JCM 9112 / NBRC 15066 / NRRL 15764) TaxID=1179773 RepID=K0JTG0_SACES|nr:asparaginase [Saccharothrix espanaensis]CCH29196.1 L-asparaginase II [Saccharothrix espanaensis DSM 44229]
MAHELVAEVWRGDFLESEHHGSVVALDSAGGLRLAVGQPDQVAYPRSSNKPVQALAMLRHGLDLDGELLALACASHSGEDFHVAGATRVLAAAGLTPDALRCTPDLPIGEAALRAHLAAGRGKAPIYMNCSGKHAAMLATCVVNDWPTGTYLDPAHPLQTAIRDTLEELAGERIGAEGVDGCGAPLFGISLVGLARAFARLAAATDGPERRIARAMSSHPEWVGGTGRDVTALMRAIPGAVAKDGAEGVYAIGLPTGEAVACKIADGSSRARAVVLVAALRRLGVDAPADLATFPVLGHGRPVGAVRPAAVLAG